MRCARVCLLIVLLAATACGSSSTDDGGALGAGSSGGAVSASGASGTTTPPRIVGFRGSVNSCPARHPTLISNVGVTGLGSRLVPIDVTKVRICRYRSARGTPTAAKVQLDGTGLQTGAGAQRLRDSFNALPAIAAAGSGRQLPSCVPPDRVWFLLTFAADAQMVVVSQKGCPYVTNNGRSSTFTAQLGSVLASSVVGSG